MRGRAGEAPCQQVDEQTSQAERAAVDRDKLLRSPWFWIFLGVDFLLWPLWTHSLGWGPLWMSFCGIFAILGGVVTLVGRQASHAGVVVDTAAYKRRPIPERVRNEVWRRDQGRCVDCSSRERLEFDHIIPISKGGSNTARNLELRCETCNRKKAARV